MDPFQMNQDLTSPLLTFTLEIDSYFVVVAFLLVFEEVFVAAVFEALFVAVGIDDFEVFVVFSVVGNHMAVVFVA